MKCNRKLFKNFPLIFIVFFIFISKEIKSQNVIQINNNVISYCYQPSVGLHQIFAINTNGTNNRKIINASIGLNHHDWSPDTMKFVAVGYFENFNTWSIHTFNSDGTNFVRLTNVNNVWDTEPTWSPDMTKISFVRIYPNQNMRNELWIMNANGSDQHYVGVDAFMAKWSKDGTKFIYTSKKAYNNYDLYVSDTNGANDQRLTDTPLDEMYPIYSPAGNEIAYCSGSYNIYNDWEIYKMKSNGTGIRKLTNNNSYDGSPRWSPDGTIFSFGSDRDETEKWEIYIMDTSGTNVQRVTYSPVNITAINPVWRPATTTKVININNIIPENFKLFQNYPNPFNPTTIIRFQIKDLKFVILKVYNILGEEVVTLVNGKLIPGEYEIPFSIDQYTNNQVPSGIYFYRLGAGNYFDTKKMILIK